MLVEGGGPHMWVPVLDWFVRPETQIYEVVRLLLQHAHYPIEHLKVLALRVLLRGDVHHAVMIDSCVRLRCGYALFQRTKKEGRGYAEAMHLRILRRGADAGCLLPGNERRRKRVVG